MIWVGMLVRAALWAQSICQHPAQCKNRDACDKRHARIQVSPIQLTICFCIYNIYIFARLPNVWRPYPYEEGSQTLC